MPFSRSLRRLTRTSPYDREIFRLAIPALGALAAEPLFLLTDSAIVGHLGTPQLAALGLAGTILQTLLGVFVFLAYATTASVARSLGAGDLKSALSYGIDGLWLALGIGLAVTIGAFIAAPGIVGVFNPPDDVAGYALTYLRIGLIGLPAMFMTFAGTGVLRGLQDTRTPLIVAVAMYAANIVLNVVFVYGLSGGIAGSAWGTTLAQLGGAIAYLVIVVRGARRHHTSLKPDRKGIRAAARAGGALFVRTITLRIALLVTTFVATSYGAVALAAHQVAFTLWNGLALALDAIAIAGQALVGKALGAGDIGSTRAATRRMIEWSIAAGAIAGLFLVLARPLYVPLFTSDPAVRDQLSQVILVFAVFLPAAGVVFALDGVLIGAGDGRYLAVAGVWTLVAYLPLAAIAYWWPSSGLIGLWLAFGGFTLARLATLVVRERRDAWLVTGTTKR